jgi:hypothetical protein
MINFLLALAVGVLALAVGAIVGYVLGWLMTRD